MNQTACGVIRCCLTQDLNETSIRQMRKILESKYLTKNIKNFLHLKRWLYRFQLNKGIFIGEHMNNYTKFLAGLPNME